MSAALRLEVLGHFRLRDTHGQELVLTSRKARALLVYLALRCGLRIERERLAALLWEDSDLAEARTSLRQALAGLRRAFPEGARTAVLADGATVALAAASVSCDAVRVRELLLDARPDALLEAMELYQGDLLEGFETHSAAFDEWLATERQQLRRDVAAGIERLAKVCADNGDVVHEFAALTRLLTVDPVNERAHRALIQWHARQRDHTAALRQYRVCREVLRRELDVAPDPATESLYRELLQRRQSAPSESAERAEATPETTARAPAAASRDSSTMREAVVLAVRWSELSRTRHALDPEDSRELVTAAIARVTETVTAHGGLCDQFAGERLLAVFGIDATHGNEPSRTARAALEIAATLPRLHEALTPTIGIASGPLLPAGAQQVFPLAGPAVGIAIELAQRAEPGSVLISGPVQRALAVQPNFAISHVRDRNDRETSGLWRLEHYRPERAALATPFSGRRAEIALVSALLERAVESRRGRTVLVRGEPGIGKSRLIEEISAVAAARGVREHAAQALDFGQMESQRPLAALARSLLDLGGSSRSALAQSAIEVAAERCNIAREDLIFLGELIAAPLPSDLATIASSLDAETRQHGRARVLARLLEGACQSFPRLLIVEDVHWAEPAEVARLADLSASLVSLPAILLLSTRPEDDPCTSTWRARARGCPVTTLDLAPLAGDEARELAAHYEALDEDVLEDCLERAAGHPMFLDQLLRAAQAGERTLPGSIRALALAKIDRLPTAARQALQAAAVLGLEFARPTLESLLAVDHVDLEPLESAGLVLAATPAEYRFVHALFRDAVYDSLLKTSRRELHRRAAEVYGGGDPALRAWHLEQAQDPRAAEAALFAARAEYNTVHTDRAVTLARTARRLARDAELLKDASCLLGDLAMQSGHTHDAIASFREAIDFSPSRPGRASPWFGLAAALRIVDRYEEALDALEQAESCLEGIEDPTLRARIWSLRGNLHFPRGDLEACLEAHEQAHRHAELANSPIEVARALGGLGDAWYQRGRMLTAADFYRRCVASCADHKLTGLELAYLPMLGLTRAFGGDVAAARDDAERAAATAERLSDLRADLVANDVNASICLYQADYASALAAADRTIHLARQLGARRFEIEAIGVRGLALVGLEARERALPLLEEAAEAACIEASTYCAPWMLAAYAAALADSARRREILQRGECVLLGGAVSHNHLEFYRLAIEVALQEHWWSEAHRLATALENYTIDEPLPWARAIIERGRALAEAGSGSSSRELRRRLGAIAAQATQMHFHSLVPALQAAITALPDQH